LLIIIPFFDSFIEPKKWNCLAIIGKQSFFGTITKNQLAD